MSHSHLIPILSEFILDKPEISWSKDGKKLDSKKKKDKKIKADWDALGDTFLLEILNANKDDAGEYTVTAKNAQGEVSQTVKVNVEPKKEAPKILDSSKPVSVVEGDDILLQCKFEGIPIFVCESCTNIYKSICITMNNIFVVSQ